MNIINLKCVTNMKTLFLLSCLLYIGIGSAEAQNEIEILSKNDNYINPNNTLQKGTEITFQINFYSTATAAKYDTLSFIVFPKTGGYIDYVFVNRPDFNLEFRKIDFLSTNSTLNMTLDTLDRFGKFKLRIFDSSPNEYCALNIALNTYSTYKEYIVRNITLHGCITSINNDVSVNEVVVINASDNKLIVNNTLENKFIDCIDYTGELIYTNKLLEPNETLNIPTHSMLLIRNEQFEIIQRIKF